jgi:sulfur carrier protein
MKILFNGEIREFDRDSISIVDLLKAGNVEMPDMVSVQHNGAFVERTDYSSILVKNNDEVDFLYFMGGGSR